jgi:hypothetical protein
VRDKSFYLPCSYGCSDPACDACVPYESKCEQLPSEKAEVVAWLRRAMLELDKRWSERLGRS